MKKNKIKDIIDLLRIMLLILIIVMHSISFSLIAIMFFILLTIIDRFYWKCKNCKKQLPNKIWFNTVKCCPYCKTDIDKI